MALETGKKLGPYEIRSHIGAGGMGEVYLGRDTKLDRDVAIKVLPDALAHDAERLARFQREAKVLASLNHPNIAAIYGLQESVGTSCLVLEYVEGETLAARLKRGPLAADQALDVARQMTEALEAAHDKGVIHRDLKPGNVMLRLDGVVKVLDFGLAKALVDDSPKSSFDNSPTITADYTKPGVVLGTAAYMSPEQARGRPLDKRTDIWSFGVVLFECLSGRRPFEGDTTSDLVARILEREPDWTALPASTPPLIQLLLRRCLAKNHKRRLRDIGDARVDIETALDDPTSSGLLLAHGALAASSERRRGRAPPIAVMLAIAALVGVGIGWLVRRAEPVAATPVIRFTVDIPPTYSLNREEDGRALSLNPAGSMLAFATRTQGKQQIFIHDLSEGRARLVPGSEGGGMPFFSPDGRWLGFFARGKLMKVPVSGGPPLVVCDATRKGGAWLDDGTIVFTGSGGILRVDDSGGDPQLLATGGPTTRTDDGKQLVLGFCSVEAVPGANYLVAGVWDGITIQDYATVAVSLSDGTVRPLMHRAVDARYVSPGYLVFLRESSLMAAPFDVERGVVTGEAFQVVEGVLSNKWADTGQFAFSASGTLAYVPGGRSGLGRRLVRVDLNGKSEPLMEGTDAMVGGIRVSPDGLDISLLTMRRHLDLWTFNLARRAVTLVSNTGEMWGPVWRPDGEAFVYQQQIPEQETQIVLKRIDSADPAEPVPIERPGDIVPSSFSLDGRHLLLIHDRDGTGGIEDIVLYHWGKSGPTEVVLGTPADEEAAMFAPDGEHFAYVSNETGRYEVFVRTFPETDRKWQVSLDGGHSPVWARDGKSLFFLDHNAVMHRAPVDSGTNYKISTPQQLFDTTTVATTDLWGAYDVLPDGDFIMVEPADWEKEAVRIHVTTNWVTELSK